MGLDGLGSFFFFECLSLSLLLDGHEHFLGRVGVFLYLSLLHYYLVLNSKGRLWS
jgi:hypothetical protein